MYIFFSCFSFLLFVVGILILIEGIKIPDDTEFIGGTFISAFAFAFTCGLLMTHVGGIFRYITVGLFVGSIIFIILFALLCIYDYYILKGKKYEN
jgi:Ca2+/Na+ antiporter